MFASSSRLTRLFQVALDTCLDSPPLCQPLSSRFALHGLRAFAFWPKKILSCDGLRAPKIAIANRRVILSQTSPSPAKLLWGCFLRGKIANRVAIAASIRRNQKIAMYFWFFASSSSSSSSLLCRSFQQSLKEGAARPAL